MNVTNTHQIENLKTQLQQELQSLLSNNYNSFYLRDSIYQKVREFEQINYNIMHEYDFDVIDESGLESGKIGIDVALVPKAVITTTFSLDNTTQNRIEKREIMKKKINKIRNA